MAIIGTSKKLPKPMKIALLTGKPTDVTAGNYNDYAFITAAKNRGHEIHTLVSGQQSVAANPADIPLKASPLDFDALIPRLKTHDFEAGCVALSGYQAQGVYCLNSPAALHLARRKFQCLQVLARHHLPIPRTLWLPTEADLCSFMEITGSQQLIIKTNLGSIGKGVMLAESLGQVRALIDYLHAVHEPFFIQEFIAESAGQDMRALVLDGQIIGAVKRQANAPGEFRSNISRGGMAGKITLSPQQQQLALDAAKAVGLTFAGVDLIESADQTYVLEVNGNPGFQAVDQVYNCQTAEKVIAFIEQHVAANAT
ncbi:MAG: hypothetical protein CMM87_01850 [Rickettsiales bacterium]|nr:hypothetical protein [Rickettsiales bacterium]|tara:strand:+ start:597 stop:1532 length:936 start_codon:yes stop_codon:yes gene_type:complete